MPDLRKTQLVACQQESPSAAVPPGARVVTIAGTIHAPPPGLTMRRSLWATMQDGSEQRLASQSWPQQAEVVVSAFGVARVWTKIDPDQPITFGETLTMQ